MEVAERYSIAWKELGNGVHDFDFRVDGALFRAFESPDIREGSCGVHVRLERRDTSMTLDFVIEGEVVVPCDRCLEDCSVPVDFEGRLLVRISDQPGEYDGDTMWLLPSEELLDLSQYIYESVVLSLPYQRVHPEGECDPGMLERFRIVSGEEFAAVERRAEEGSSALSAEQQARLEALRGRMTGGETESGGETVGD